MSCERRFSERIAARKASSSREPEEPTIKWKMMNKSGQYTVDESKEPQSGSSAHQHFNVQRKRFSARIAARQITSSGRTNEWKMAGRRDSENLKNNDNKLEVDKPELDNLLHRPFITHQRGFSLRMAARKLPSSNQPMVKRKMVEKSDPMKPPDGGEKSDDGVDKSRLESLPLQPTIILEENISEPMHIDENSSLSPPNDLIEMNLVKESDYDGCSKNDDKSEMGHEIILEEPMVLDETPSHCKPDDLIIEIDFAEEKSGDSPPENDDKSTSEMIKLL
ncbi:uncharacterized protein LOC141851008 [Brevipalpus obovatus]|uniref:uncharacterized protein LOC141851008 n=1 Tax=Brevipalpus obovatus TaxID=246614 RepID=UPI003D9F5041